jgi:Protein of unknown function (DUF3592)
MPAPIGMGLGEPPPPPVRVLPKRFEFQQRWSRNVATLAGLGMLFIASLFFLAALKARSFAALVPLFFMLIGASLFRMGWRTASGILRAFRKGVAVEGKVVEVRLDKTQSVNERHPWVMTYQFPVGEELVEGSITSFSSVLATRGGGQPLWVLYVPDDPTQNTIFPPLR